ncbi:HAD-IC family P-type ATPase [Echinicola marina]|uniref:cation-translocating P-type ATPase n=1 Tax=Echinicola marina TaxID=2859768 RepID=UPI001CF628BE|nr:HAD-IC family P-type ATPase [Echinicola marina]UCS92033.1 HAD-IC family P-type ATPase [Echinicola marina]
MKYYHQLSTDEVLKELNSSQYSGLSEEEISNRRAIYGWNEFAQGKRISLIGLFFKQFKSWLVIILLIAAAISYLTGHSIDTYVILFVVLVNALIGFVQEFRAERAVHSLREMLVPQARVIRHGQTSIIPSRELVPGDILILEEGGSIAADARIIESNSLRVNESALTGESIPVEKVIGVLPAGTVLPDRNNMLWKGTFVSAGFGMGVVTEIGSKTELGKIAQTISEIKVEKTNFQKKTDKLASQMAMLAIGGTLFLFFVGYFFSDFELGDLAMVSLAMMVSAVPEGLPAVLSIVLAIGSHRMVKRNAIIREISSVETLGAVTSIITDKTGTLTQNTLTARKIYMIGQEEFMVEGDGWTSKGGRLTSSQGAGNMSNQQLKKLIQVVAICNNAAFKENGSRDAEEIIGDPTEGALLVLAKKSGMLDTNEFGSIRQLKDFPFNSSNKLRASLCEVDASNELFVVGAAEKIVALSNSVLRSEGIDDLGTEEKNSINQKINIWSSEAMRVIGVAYKGQVAQFTALNPEVLDELIFVGIVGIVDPLRPGVHEAIQKCKAAGIRVVMATGDHINTATAIARAAGITDQRGGETLALSETELEKLDEGDFQKVIQEVNVFARLSPLMKLKIAQSLQDSGELIAMTGDGVNDAPALKKADVGVSMGIMGTDVAREASKMVLVDDNFSTIVSAIEEGRIVFNNARNTSFFLVTTNFAEVVTMVILILLGYPLPLTAIQILWLNLVTDGFGDLALAAEKGHGDELKKNPISKDENILNQKVLPFLLMMSIIMVGLCILIYFWNMNEGIEKVRTAVFVTMSTTQLFNLFNMRSLDRSVFSIGFFSNRWVHLSFILSLAVEVLIIEIPFFQRIFDFVHLGFLEFLGLILISSSVLWVGELYKLFRKRYPSNKIGSLYH